MHHVIVGGDGQGGSRGRQTRPGADGGLEEELEIRVMRRADVCLTSVHYRNTLDTSV